MISASRCYLVGGNLNNPLKNALLVWCLCLGFAPDVAAAVGVISMAILMGAFLINAIAHGLLS